MNVEDHVGLHVAAEYHADTSELVQMLRKGHHGVALDAEAWGRLITRIDLNGPCHGTWHEVARVPASADRHRRELALEYGGPKEDPELVVDSSRPPVDPIVAAPTPDRAPLHVTAAGWPFDAAEAQRRQREPGHWETSVDLGEGVTLRLVRIPAGEFVMGSEDGEQDEYPPARVRIPHDFWMGAYEVTNAQFHCFDPRHFSGYFAKRFLSNDGPGIDLNGPNQPAVRVSWDQAMAFCRWLSQRTGLGFSLPSEAEWEYACRAGTSQPLSFGGLDDDFSRFPHLADSALVRTNSATSGLVLLQDFPADRRFDDGGIATTNVGRYEPNAWGLFDMHGNAAEWALSAYRPYPYDPTDGREAGASTDRRVVRGGSFFDRPKRCRSAFRLDYPPWQRVHNVGFRLACRTDMLPITLRNSN